MKSLQDYQDKRQVIKILKHGSIESVEEYLSCKRAINRPANVLNGNSFNMDMFRLKRLIKEYETK